MVRLNNPQVRLGSVMVKGIRHPNPPMASLSSTEVDGTEEKRNQSCDTQD